MALDVQTIRNLVSDIDLVTPILPDDSYQQIIDLGETNAYRAAGVACRQLSALFAVKVDLKAGSVSLANSQKAEAYLALAQKYDNLADQGYGDDPSTPVTPLAGFLGVILSGVSVSEMNEVADDTDRFPSAFTIGMDDNPGSETEEKIP